MPELSRQTANRAKLEASIVPMARENSGWCYDRIVGALSNLGYYVSDETVGNVLRPHYIEPAPKRSQNTTWKEFIQGGLGWNRLLHRRVLSGAAW